MARTKAQARAAASQRPWQVDGIVRTIDDWKIVWPRSNRNTSSLPPFPFHVYLIRGADSLTVDDVLADKLLYCLLQPMLCDPCWHLEVATFIQDNVWACIDHYEQEKRIRRSDSKAPYMPDKNSFLVIDSDKWEIQGLLSVQYTKENAHLPYDMHAERYKSWDHLATHLREQWSDQGMTTVEELLDAQNLARGWPIDLNCYPENGPDERVNGMTLTADEQACPISHQPADEALDLEDISVDVNGVIYEQLRDFGGFPCTALRSDSSQAPHFAFCLFVVGREMSTESSLEVFACLNTGLLANVSWILHLYSGVTMSSACSIFALEMDSRRQTDTSTHVPSSYAGPPLQIYRDVYMCLDASKLQPNGPSFILSSPDPDHAPAPKHDVDPDDLHHVSSHHDKYAGEPDSLDIFTFRPGSWELAADMLHTYYAVCSHTQFIRASLSSPIIPRVSLRMSITPEISSDPAVPSPMELFITSHAPQPITVNAKGTLLDTLSWHHYVRIVPAGSCTKLRRDETTDRSPRVWSLGRSLLDYGFTKRAPDTGEDRPPHLVTLHPGVPLRLPVQRPLPADPLAELRPDENEDDKRFLEDYEAEAGAHFSRSGTFGRSLYERYRGSWEVGKKYTVELQHGTTIPRWTWGTADNLKGPYGLPELEIEVEDGPDRDFVLIE